MSYFFTDNIINNVIFKLYVNYYLWNSNFFIFKVLPKEVAVATIINTKFENGYIYSPATKAFKKSLEQYINNLEELILSCDTSEDFEKKFSEKYNINYTD